MIIESILDTDLYKLSQSSVVAALYSEVQAEYTFINRGGTKFPPGFAKVLREQVDAMQELNLSSDEYEFLRKECYYLKPSYIDLLRGFRYDPEQVEITQSEYDLSVIIRGPWYLTIYYEVPLMSIISELYFKMMGCQPADNWKDLARAKFARMSNAGCMVSDFGSRRRFSFMVHDGIVRIMKDFKCCAGTSNVYLAHKYDLTPIGTMAHEFIMGHAAMFGYRSATRMALEAWVWEYEGNLGIALPDTFTTDVFLRDFGTFFGKLFDGVRHDSGDWKEFTEKIIAHYKVLGIDPATKTIVYSDSLNAETILEIHEYVNGRIRDRYGVGTNISNDCGHTPLNMVIKMTSLDGVPTVKLSDGQGKAVGPSEAIAHCKTDLGL